MCYVWWYYGSKLLEPWNLNSSSTLLCILRNKTSNLLKVWHRWHGFCYYSELISYTHTEKHTEDTHQNKYRLTHTHKYILTPSVMCTKQLPVLHWMKTLLIQKFTLKRSTISLLLKNCWLAEVIYMLLRFNNTRSFLWNTKITDKNGYE